MGVVYGGMQREAEEESLHELAALATTAGAEVIEMIIQERKDPDASTFIGRGKVQEIKTRALEIDANIIIFDVDLTPAQIKNLESEIKQKIIDRSGIILDIFAKRAKSHESKVQVELAQLQYLYPRLTRHWSHLSRQEGGVGTRGPGETQLETDRRLIRKRIDRLKAELNKIEKQRQVRRTGRKEFKKVALVGYTNVGKSSLMNALSDSDTFVEDQLFATLDATVRGIELPDLGKVLLIDTVGFIKKLPHHLVASFRSTLEESLDADLLLHVVDISHENHEEQRITVEGVLEDINLQKKPVLLVYNKVDALADNQVLRDSQSKHDNLVFTSAKSGIGLENLRYTITRILNEGDLIESVRLSNSETKIISDIYALSKVLKTDYDEDEIIIQFKSSKENTSRIHSILKQAGIE